MIYSFSHLQQIISTYCPASNARCSKDSVYSPPRPVKILHIALCIIKHSMILHLSYGKIDFNYSLMITTNMSFT